MKYVCPECGDVADGPVSHITNDICSDCGVVMQPDSSLDDETTTKSALEAACVKHGWTHGHTKSDCEDCDD